MPIIFNPYIPIHRTRLQISTTKRTRPEHSPGETNFNLYLFKPRPRPPNLSSTASKDHLPQP